MENKDPTICSLTAITIKTHTFIESGRNITISCINFRQSKDMSKEIIKDKGGIINHKGNRLL